MEVERREVLRLHQKALAQGRGPSEKGSTILFNFMLNRTFLDSSSLYRKSNHYLKQ